MDADGSKETQGDTRGSKENAGASRETPVASKEPGASRETPVTSKEPGASRETPGQSRETPGQSREPLSKEKGSKEVVLDENGVPRFEAGYIIKNEYKILEKLDEGGFGQVFKGESIKNGNFFAIKVEPSNMEGGSAIKLEMDVLTSLCSMKVPHFPQFYHAGRKPGYQYVVMELLGPNLKSLRQRAQNPDVISSGTWSRIGIQCLYVIKLLHDAGFVHRDIKPSNFAMGYPNDDNLNGRMIYLLDFGLARRYILKKSTSERQLSKKPSKTSKNEMVVEMVNELYKFRKPRRNAEFRGTHRYASPNAHSLCELGRADDLYSLLYMLIEMYQPLPWAYTSDGNEITTMKMFYAVQELCGKFDELVKLFQNLSVCQYYSRPSYELFYEVFLGIMNKAHAKMNDPYDWDEDDEYERWIRLKHAKKTTFVWENGMEFFKKDPWEIKSTKNENSDRSLKKLPKESKERLPGCKTKDGRLSPMMMRTPTSLTPPRTAATPRKEEKRDKDTKRQLPPLLCERSTYIGDESRMIHLKPSKNKASKETPQKNK